MTTFKAVDGWTTLDEAKHLATLGGAACVTEGQLSSVDQPCTIIPGHWAERIESGELLTEEEMLQVWEDWHNVGGGQIGLVRAVSKTIARKLRGEA